MKTNTLVISDKEFIEQYRSLNVFHRKIVCEACLKSFDHGNEVIKRSIGVEITYQFVSLLEDLAMVFLALRDIDKYDGSFVKSLLKIAIKEDGSNYSTDGVIKDISRLLSLSFEDLLLELHLPDFETIKNELDLTKEEEANIKELKSQYQVEITKTIETIKDMVANRILDKRGETFGLVKIGNKIKHGSMFLLEHQDDSAVFYPLKAKVFRDKNKLEGYYIISSNKESLGLIVQNMSLIGQLMSDLLLIFSKTKTRAESKS